MRSIGYKIGLVTLIAVVSFGCIRNDQYRYAKSIVEKLPNHNAKYTMYFVIPGAGCNGCISNAEYFLKTNYGRKNIRFILTAVDSKKILALKLGEEIVNSNNIYIDVDNEVGPSMENENAIYPFIIQLDKNRIVDIFILSPEGGNKSDQLIEKINETPFYTINLKEFLDLKLKSNLPGDSLFETIKKVKLGSPTGDVNLGSPLLIKESREYYFILDEYMRLFKYNHDGEFIRFISQKGRGPSEYSDLFTFCLDEDDEALFLLDAYQKKILIYSFNGEYRGKVSLPFVPLNFSYCGNKTFVLYVPDYHQETEEKYELFWVDWNGKVVSKALQYTSMDRSFSPDLFNVPKLTYEKGLIYYWPFNTDNYFVVDNLGDIKTYMCFLQGNYLAPSEVSENVELFNKNLNKYILQLNITNANRFAFLRFIYKMQNYGVIYDKYTRNVYLSSKGQEQAAIYSDRYQLTFWPAFTSNDKLFAFEFQEKETFLLTLTERE